jgi:hypothetical protein
MFDRVSEKRMHLIRWLTTSGWLLLIASLFYDPISPWLTLPEQLFSPLRIEPTVCVEVQGKCLEERPYALGATSFWGLVVPMSIFILSIFGHELWRRICPLSFLSQLPRSLGLSRQLKRVNEKTGKIRYELAKVKPESWLGRNYLYLQFGFLYLGLCARILFINSDRLALAVWFIVTILAAIAVGYLYGGKSWCNYFCPMAPVQKIYSEPGGLFSSKAHQSDRQITQSMCRIVIDGKEQSACVACQNPCIDIDSERSYWESITQPKQKVLYYGYVGLVIGYFCYYYLYAGNWNYYFSGAWAHQENQLATLRDPGFYLLNTPIPIPKLVAVPLTLAAFSGGGYLIGRVLEECYRTHVRRTKQPLSKEVIQHRLFTFCTFAVFNFFFIFAGKPLILLMPLKLQFIYESILVGLSTLWFYRTWHRSPDRYFRESLANRLRRQLSRLELNLSQFIERRSLDDLTTDEVYVLAKILPEFSQEKRCQAYKGVLREVLEEGYANTSSSLEVLKQMRSELSISEDKHRLILEELGVEDPELLDPNRQRTLENQSRLSSYRQALERMLAAVQHQTHMDSITEKKVVRNWLQNNLAAIRALRQEYSVTLQEEAKILENFDREAHILRRAGFLLRQLDNLINRYHNLHQPWFHEREDVLTLLRSAVKKREQLLVTELLAILEYLECKIARDSDSLEPLAIRLARSLNNLSSSVLQEMLSDSVLHPRQPDSLHQRFSPEIISVLSQPGEMPLACSLELEPETLANHLEALLFEPNPPLQAIGLYVLYQLDRQRGKAQAASLLTSSDKPHPFVQEVAVTLCHPSTINKLTTFNNLEKLVHLFNSDFFGGVQSETLIKLAERATIDVYNVKVAIAQKGDPCKELLLLIEGIVEIQRHQQKDETIAESLQPGYVLNELEVLSHTKLVSTIIAKASLTRILTIPVEIFDDLLDRDRDFARRKLELKSRCLQQSIRSNKRFST